MMDVENLWITCLSTEEQAAPPYLHTSSEWMSGCLRTKRCNYCTLQDDRRPVLTLMEHLWGHLFADKGYLSQPLTRTLLQTRQTPLGDASETGHGQPVAVVARTGAASSACPARHGV